MDDALQSHRATMGSFRTVWSLAGTGVAWSSHLQELLDEFWRTVLSAPFLIMDLRTPSSALATYSDASEKAAGVYASAGVSGLGARFLEQFKVQAAARGRGRICLLETFAGIGGARRAMERLGVEVALYLYSEIDETAKRVLAAAWPQGIDLGDVRTITAERLRREAHGAPDLQLVIHVAGSPCPDVSGLNASRVCLQGKRSSLFYEAPKVTEAAKAAFLGAIVHACEENVASMDNVDRDEMSRVLGRIPLRICASGVTWCRRPRYYWPSWDMASKAGASIEVMDGYKKVTLRGEAPAGQEWLPKG